MEVIAGQRYKHYKNGKTYLVVAVGRDEESTERVVVYRAEYDDVEFGNNAVWIRPYEMFVGSVEINGMTVSRFTLL